MAVCNSALAQDPSQRLSHSVDLQAREVFAGGPEDSDPAGKGRPNIRIGGAEEEKAGSAGGSSDVGDAAVMPEE